MPWNYFVLAENLGEKTIIRILIWFSGIISCVNVSQKLCLRAQYKFGIAEGEKDKCILFI